MASELHVVFSIQEVLSRFKFLYVCHCHVPVPLSGCEGEKTSGGF